MNEKLYFVVEMCRFNDQEGHRYTIGVFDDEALALKEAWEHIQYRGGKYGALITGWNLNGGTAKYSREMSCWSSFEESCKDLAEKVKKLMEE